MASILQSIWHWLIRSQTGKTIDDCNTAVKRSDLQQRVSTYLANFDATLNNKWDAAKDSLKKSERLKKAQVMTNAYYDIATDFYEYGWGQSFHFATRAPNESFETSIVRHEHQLAHRMGIKQGDRVLDVGCGVGGPMRNIARFTETHITGLNNNEYQVKRAKRINHQQHLDHLTDVVHGDFMNIQLPSESFDHVYAIEATCHAPNRTECFKQIYKVLKPGGCFAGYEWTMTDKYDKNNPRHNEIKHGIEIGNSIPSLTHYTDIVHHLKAAGFEVESAYDLADEKHTTPVDTPWWASFVGSWLNPAQFKHTVLGRRLTNVMCYVMETLHIAPPGTTETARFLCETGDALAESGKTGVFTPMFYFQCRKPLNKKTQ